MNKILIVKNAFEQIGGVDKQIIRIAKSYQKDNFMKVMLATSSLTLPLAKVFADFGLGVYKINIKSTSILQSGKQLSKIIKENKIDYVQSHLFRESLICRVAKFYNPTVKHIFRAQTYIDVSWIPKWKKYLYHFLDKITSPWVDIYIANGPEVKKEIINKSFVSQKKVIDVINGTEKVGEPDTLSNEPISYKIAMVANLLEKKGHDTLIKGLGLLKQENIIVKVRLIGDEISGGFNYKGISFKDKLLKLAKQNRVLEQIEFYGYTNNIYTALQGFTIIVLPSDSEGVPNSISEAMSLKKIVIASDVGAVYKLIDDGVDGFLHKPSDHIDFANTLKQTLLLYPKELNIIKENAYSKWQNNFELKKMIDEFKKVYKTLSNENL